MDTVHKDVLIFMIASGWIIFIMKNVSDEIVEKIKTHSMSNDFFSENRAICDIMWKNVVDTERSQKTIWSMRFACWVTKATHNHSEYVIHCFSTVTTISPKHLNVTLYVHCLTCLLFLGLFYKIFHSKDLTVLRGLCPW